MDRCDVAVVGGGPAGSSCARDLVAAGLDVVVIDRAVFPRDKVCAGWITPSVVSTLDLDLADYAAGRTLQPFHGFCTSAIGRREVRTHYGRPISFGIRRCEFDHYLLARSGARLRPGTPLGSLERSGAGWIVNGELEARVLVGAGGHFCPVARRLNPGREPGPVVAAQEVEFRPASRGRGSEGVAAQMPALYFAPDRKGYGWCVRKGDYLNVGFGRIASADGDPLPDHIAAFREFVLGRGAAPDDLPDRWHGHAYRLNVRPRRRLFDAGVVLVGDAAGLAYPISGEGILTAVESGRLAARVIAAADGDYSHARLALYERALERCYGAPPRYREEPWRLPPSMVSWMGVRLMGTRWFARRVLLDRWFLHAGRPPLG